MEGNDQVVELLKWMSGISLWQVAADEAWSQLAPLLCLADEDQEMIVRYLLDCDYWALRQDDQFIASIAVRPLPAEEAMAPTWEIMNLAVAPAKQNQGLGGWLVAWIWHKAVLTHQQTLLVGTGDASLANLRFYLRQGFRFDHVRRDFFKQYDQPIFEDGIQLRDMVVLAQELPRRQKQQVLIDFLKVGPRG
ncbi:GNAT family N-acetyltransferase [Lapidilactobacillus salsurivasis]